MYAALIGYDRCCGTLRISARIEAGVLGRKFSVFEIVYRSDQPSGTENQYLLTNRILTELLIFQYVDQLKIQHLRLVSMYWNELGLVALLRVTHFHHYVIGIQVSIHFER